MITIKAHTSDFLGELAAEIEKKLAEIEKAEREEIDSKSSDNKKASYGEGYDDGYNDGAQEVFDSFRALWEDSSPYYDFDLLKKAFVHKAVDFESVKCLEDLLDYIFENNDSYECVLEGLDRYDEIEASGEDGHDYDRITPDCIVLAPDGHRIAVIDVNINAKDVDASEYIGYDLTTGKRVSGSCESVKKIGTISYEFFEDEDKENNNES